MKTIPLVITTALFAAACGERRQKPQEKAPVTSIEPAIEKEPALSAPPIDIIEPDVVEAPAEVVPTSYREMIKMGKSFEKDGDIVKAKKMFSLAIAERPHALTPKIEMARMELQLGNTTAARESAEAAVEINEESSYAWNTLGRVALAEGDRSAAIEAFRTATDANEDNAYAWNNLGLTLMLDKDFPAAAEALESATGSANPKPYMWNNLGQAYEQLGKLIEARAAYTRGVEGGSAKAKASLERLKDVKSLPVPAEVIEGETTPEPTVETPALAPVPADASPEN